MAKLVWTEPALDDVREIVAYIRRDSSVYAKKMGQRLREAPKVLKTHPKRGWQIPEYDDADLRELLVFPYRVIYRIIDDTCYVIAVVHGSRDLTRIIRPSPGDEASGD